MFFNKYIKYLAAIILCIACFKSYSQDKDIPKELYSTSGIPDSLKEDANSIIRYSNNEITIKGPDKAIVRYHKLITILNEKGDEEAQVVLQYNRKYDSYSHIDIRVYNAEGMLLKKYHKSDMYDGSASNDETIVTDDRFLGLRHTVVNYPSTIEVEYEEDISSFISLDSWIIQHGLEQSIQNSTCKVLAAPKVGFRYKCKNTSLEPVKGNEAGYETYTWQAKNIKAIKKEENVLPWNVLPKIMFGTTTFDCYGYPGDISTWQNFGKWIQGLNNDVSALSPQRVIEIKQMTDTIKTDKGKVAFLYKYMQQSMRYVSVQLGIGGYKPFAATFVDQKKYGDCKALANYMHSLLKAIDIPSYYAIIRAGENEEPADVSFPHNSFNHAILCVPLKGDTTWLECTSSTQQFGKLGPFTENRNALIITENGGELVNTPKSNQEDNQFNSQVHLVLDANGGAKAQVKILSTGGYRDTYVGLASLKTDEQKEYLIHSLNIKQPSIFDFKTPADNEGVKEVNIEMEYEKFCDITAGDKQFYRPRLFDLWGMTVPVLEKRKTDFYFEHPMLKSCVTTIDLPEGFTVETLPADQNLKFTYGNYEIKYVYDNAKNQVISTARFSLTNQVIPANKYTEMQQYMDAIAKAQKKKLVIHRKA